MKRMKLCFAIIAVMFLIKGLAFAQDTTLTVTSAGNVGIGTTNPAFLLDVFGTNYKVRYNSGGNVDVLINRASNSNFGNLQYASDNTLLWAIGLRGVSAADGLFFHDEDAGTTRMMIDGTSGNVGIGTTSPSFPFHIISPSGIGNIMRIESDNGNSANFRIKNTSSGGREWLLSSDGASGNAGAGAFRIRDNTALQDRLTIDNNGNVGIGTTSPIAPLHITPNSASSALRIDQGTSGDGILVYVNTTSSEKTLLTATSNVVGLHVKGDGSVGIGTTSPGFPLEMGSGAHVTTGGVWTDASSRQYKENISNLTQEEAINALATLNPVKFNYKAEKDEEYVGFIAEDVPDLVATRARKSLSPMDIVAVLTKVVQQQQQKIAELEARFNAGQ